MSGHEKQTEVHDSLYKLAHETSKNYFIDGPLFDHMTIKQAKEKADELGRWLIRFAMDYHNSMSVAVGPHFATLVTDGVPATVSEPLRAALDGSELRRAYSTAKDRQHRQWGET